MQIKKDTGTSKTSTPKTKTQTKTSTPKIKTQAKTSTSKSKTQNKTPTSKPKTQTNVKTKTQPKNKRGDKRQTKKNNKTTGSGFGTTGQRALLAFGLGSAPFLGNVGPSKVAAEKDKKKKIDTVTDQKQRRKDDARNIKKDTGGGQTFGQAFAKARAKGIGTKFTFDKKQFVAVRDSDIPKRITGSKTERLKKYLNERNQSNGKKK